MWCYVVHIALPAARSMDIKALKCQFTETSGQTQNMNSSMSTKSFGKWEGISRHHQDGSNTWTQTTKDGRIWLDWALYSSDFSALWQCASPGQHSTLVGADGPQQEPVTSTFCSPSAEFGSPANKVNGHLLAIAVKTLLLPKNTAQARFRHLEERLRVRWENTPRPVWSELLASFQPGNRNRGWQLEWLWWQAGGPEIDSWGKWTVLSTSSLWTHVISHLLIIAISTWQHARQTWQMMLCSFGFRCNNASLPPVDLFVTEVRPAAPAPIQTTRVISPRVRHLRNQPAALLFYLHIYTWMQPSLGKTQVFSAVLCNWTWQHLQAQFEKDLLRKSAFTERKKIRNRFSIDRHPGKERRIQTQEILRNEPGSTAPVFVRAAPSAVASELPWLRSRCFDHDKLFPTPTQGVTLGLCRCKTLYLITLRQTRTRVNSYVMEYSNNFIPAACVFPKRHEWECAVLVSIRDSNHGSAAHSSFRLLLLVGYMTILHQGRRRWFCNQNFEVWPLDEIPRSEVRIFPKMVALHVNKLIFHWMKLFKLISSGHGTKLIIDFWIEVARVWKTGLTSCLSALCPRQGSVNPPEAPAKSMQGPLMCRNAPGLNFLKPKWNRHHFINLRNICKKASCVYYKVPSAGINTKETPSLWNGSCSATGTRTHSSPEATFAWSVSNTTRLLQEC